MVRLLLFLPALRLLPGQTPAPTKLKCLAERNCCMSAPVSARMLAALLLLDPQHRSLHQLPSLFQARLPDLRHNVGIQLAVICSSRNFMCAGPVANHYAR